MNPAADWFCYESGHHGSWIFGCGFRKNERMLLLLLFFKYVLRAGKKKEKQQRKTINNGCRKRYGNYLKRPLQQRRNYAFVTQKKYDYTHHNLLYTDSGG